MLKFNIYIFILLALIGFSCTDELTYRDSAENTGKGETALSVMMDIPENRTRAIDMTPGAAFYLNNMWVGIYRVSDGKRVGGTAKGAEPDFGNRITASGTKLMNLVSIEGYENNIYTNDNLVVVGVANFSENILAYTKDGGTSTKALITALREADTWDKFINIALDTEHSTFENQTPMLMGYLYKEIPESNIPEGEYTYTKVNQFVADNDNKVNLYPFGINDSYQPSDIYVTGNNNSILNLYPGTLTSIKSTGFVMKMRRLRSKMNINIETRDADMTITSVKYQVVNVPKSAYLAQRRMNVFGNGYSLEGFRGDVNSNTYSANSADVNGHGYTGYEPENESRWETPTNNTSFSYEHFENKHWAKEGFKKNDNSAFMESDLSTYYHSREEKNSDGSYKHLVGENGKATDWNNNASYVVLRMSVRDLKTGRNADIEYTIHEGFCNDKDGLALVNEGGNTKPITGDQMNDAISKRLSDYSCIRNTDYYYNIKINSVDDIVLTVTKNNAHPTDQANGKVYEMTYAKNGQLNYVQSESGGESTYSPAISFKDNENNNILPSDLAFRLVGKVLDETTGEYTPVDLCYNFAHGDLEGYRGLWPEPITGVTQYFVDNTIENEDGTTTTTSAYEYLDAYFPNETVEKLMEQIKVKSGTETVTIKEFVDSFQESQSYVVSGFKFEGYSYYDVESSTDNIRNELQGLYIFDKQRAIAKGSRIQTDNHDCYYYQIYAGEQLPEYLLKGKSYDMIFASGSSQPISYTGGTYNNITNGSAVSGLRFSESPNLAFRLIGFKDDGSSYDLCYNFDPKDYPEFSSVWPETTSSTTTRGKGGLSSSNIPNGLSNDIKILSNNGEHSLYDFINSYEREGTRISGTGFKVYQYNREQVVGNPRPFMRALYIFDKNVLKKPFYISDQIGHYQLYIVEQYPNYRKEQLILDNSLNANYFVSENQYYNIIDPNIGNVSIPKVTNVNSLGDYKFRIYSIGNNNIQSRDYEFNPTGNSTTIAVPMSILQSTSGKLYIQAIPVNADAYEASEIKQFGSYLLKTPPTWDLTSVNFKNLFNSTFILNENLKDGTYTRHKNNTNDTEELTFQNLTVAIGPSKVAGVNESTAGLYFNNTGSTLNINFKIFKDCKIKITANGRESGNIFKMTCEGQTTKEISLPTTKSDLVTQTAIGDINGNNVTIYGDKGTGGNFYCYIYQISITE